MPTYVKPIYYIDWVPWSIEAITILQWRNVHHLGKISNKRFELYIFMISGGKKDKYQTRLTLIPHSSTYIGLFHKLDVHSPKEDMGISKIVHVFHWEFLQNQALCWEFPKN